ncbi:hypothetical protein GCM10017779_55830 [Streptomyces capillispiralis]|uniref:Integral membrane protein n=1 Tax=Streptomyces capillispiralis TaxID=68182 RepID=A0A561T9W6_9ACTN|nr:hypothetical protein FHX78_11815 [Streptomyces capillispiralis]GHH95126.1 hypothetical protein GCM10017779_55830 [Streptomyces capillispiralis]
MSAVLVAVLLSLVSAVAYASAAVAQERLASRTAGTGPLRLLGSGAWWWAVALNASAALLHVVALKFGPLTVVQPLGALTLVAAVPMGARMAGRPVSASEWRGTALTLTGLAAVLVTASGPAPDDVLSGSEALVVAGGTACLIGMLARPGARPGLRHATASGVASGVASALTQTVTVAVTDRSGPLLGVEVVGVALLVAVFATAGLLLSQTAYRGGLGAPLAVVTLTNPLAASVIGLCLLGERLRGGPTGALLALAGAGLAARGVLLLSRAGQAHTAEPAGLTPPAQQPPPTPRPAPEADASRAGRAGPVGRADPMGPVGPVGPVNQAGQTNPVGPTTREARTTPVGPTPPTDRPAPAAHATPADRAAPAGRRTVTDRASPVSPVSPGPGGSRGAAGIRGAAGDQAAAANRGSAGSPVAVVGTAGAGDGGARVSPAA